MNSRTSSAESTTQSASPRAGVDQPLIRQAQRPRGSRISRILRFVSRWKTFTLGLAIFSLFVIGAIAAEFISPYSDATSQNLKIRLQGPSVDHPFGTDDFGRDLFSRVLHGSRVTLLVASLAVILSTLVAVPLGLAAGYLGGWFESVISRLLDALFAFPVLLLAIAVVAVMGPGVESATLAIGIAQIPQFARVARASMVSEKEHQYVEATRSVGAPIWYIIFRAILPNTLSSLLVLVSLGFAYAVLNEAALAFLGMAAQPPTPTWGNMLAVSRRHLFDNAWFSIFPGVAIFLLVFSVNLIGDGLRDISDPRRVRRS